MEGSAFLSSRIAVRKLLLNIMSSLCLFQEERRNKTYFLYYIFLFLFLSHSLHLLPVNIVYDSQIEAAGYLSKQTSEANNSFISF